MWQQHNWGGVLLVAFCAACWSNVLLLAAALSRLQQLCYCCKYVFTAQLV
jgi:hypothetical protein